MPRCRADAHQLFPGVVWEWCFGHDVDLGILVLCYLERYMKHDNTRKYACITLEAKIGPVTTRTHCLDLDQSPVHESCWLHSEERGAAKPQVSRIFSLTAKRSWALELWCIRSLKIPARRHYAYCQVCARRDVIEICQQVFQRNVVGRDHHQKQIDTICQIESLNT